jgi:hypothetical protein
VDYVVRPARDPPCDANLVVREFPGEATHDDGLTLLVEPCHCVESGGLRQSGKVGRIDPVRINDNQVPYAESSQCLDEQHPDASGADYGDFCLAKDLLSFMTIEQRLTAVTGVNSRVALVGCRSQHRGRSTGYYGSGKRSSRSTWQPDVAGNGPFGYDQRSNRRLGKPEQCRIAALV